MRNRATDGLTLVELLMALAIFALIATMSVQALQGALRSRDRLHAEADASAELRNAVVRLRRDLEAAFPAEFRDTGGVGRPSMTVSPNAGFSLSLGGQPRFSRSYEPGLARVEWRYDPATATLRRRLWPTLIPATADAAGPDIAILEDVRGLRVEAYGAAGGWSASWTPDPDGDPAALPAAIRVSIDTERFGSVELVESF